MLPSPVSRPTTTLLSSAAAGLVLALLKVYKLLISPLFSGCCRFEPSCSQYMTEAVRIHGPWRGLGKGLRRLSRCHPFGGHGFDPVEAAHHAGSTEQDPAYARRAGLALQARPTTND